MPGPRINRRPEPFANHFPRLPFVLALHASHVTSSRRFVSDRLILSSHRAEFPSALRCRTRFMPQQPSRRRNVRRERRRGERPGRMWSF